MQRILVLDPASCTGYALIDLYETFAEIIAYGSVEMNKESSSIEGDWYLDIEKKIQLLIDQYHPHKIAMEDYFISSKLGNCNLNVGIRAIFQTLARRMNLPYQVINISLWKKAISNRTKPNIAQIEKWGKTAADKLFIRQALYENFHIQFPYMMLSKNNRWIDLKSDVVDAVAMAVYLALERNIKDIKNIVFENNDSIDSKNIKKRKFDYTDLPSSTSDTKIRPLKKKKEISTLE